ncbi:nuclear hormone receptor HR96-like [Brevipalpus obovatus]|uniref:nuclear hormone receptor HR96-like n=1 Tax=Brevipalpus obovatus TaxID=246614 RepID=UPI003D9DFABF
MPAGPAKICKVCNDKANGFNFGQVTCESCKAFFRRNANKSEILQCSFQGNCTIEVKTRRFCQKCRLDKCFQVGMKREWILTEDQKKQKRAKIMENKIKKAALSSGLINLNLNINGNSNSSSLRDDDNDAKFRKLSSHNEESINSPESTSGLSAISPLIDEPPQMDDLADFLDPDRALFSSINSRIDNDLSCDLDVIEEIPVFSPLPEEGQFADGSDLIGEVIESSLPDTHVAEPSQELTSVDSSRDARVQRRVLETNFTPIFLRNRLNNSGPLNELEEFKLRELIDAHKLVDQPAFTRNYDGNTDLIELVHLSDIMIKRLITWCKQISSFRNLCQDDQIALVKGGALDMMLMQATRYFDADQKCWLDEMTGFKVDITILQKTKTDLIKSHLNFISDFSPRWRKDLNINLLLVAITLFSERPHLHHSNTVRLEQASYEYLMKRYLDSQYLNDPCQASSDYYHLMGKSEDLRELTKKHTNLYLELGPQAIGPLLMEILNLNQSALIAD